MLSSPSEISIDVGAAAAEVTAVRLGESVPAASDREKKWRRKVRLQPVKAPRWKHFVLALEFVGIQYPSVVPREQIVG